MNHKIQLHHITNNAGQTLTRMKSDMHVCGVKCHVQLDPHGLDGHFETEDGLPIKMGEVIVDCEKPLNTKLKYTFENNTNVFNFLMHRGGIHYSAMIDPKEITGDLILVY